MKNVWLTFVALVSMTSPLMAAGFAVGEQGTAALGVAGAQTAVMTSQDAGFYNPALYAAHEGLKVSVGAALLFPSLTHEYEGVSTEANSSLEIPPYLHVGYGHGFNALGVGANLSFGAPFGAGLHWPGDWEGRYEVTDIELQVLELGASLSLAYKMGKGTLAISAGPRFQFAKVSLARKIDALDVQGSVDITGDDDAVGMQVAGLLKFGAMSVGVNWRSRTTVDFVGVADFENIPLELSGRARDQSVTTSITLPSRLAFGGAFDHGDGTASMDIEMYSWSTFQSFDINFGSEATPDVSEPRNWSDTLAFRAGYEYRGLLDGFALRAGFAWDQTPSPTHTLSPTLPDSSRFIGTLGAGYQFPLGVGVHASYALVYLTQVNATGEEVFLGSYQGGANVVSLGLTYEL